MNLLFQQNHNEDFDYDYSKNKYDTKIYNYLKKQHKNINLHQVNMHIYNNNQNYHLYLNDLNADFCQMKKNHCKNYDNRDNLFFINDNFLTYNKLNNERFHMFLLSITIHGEETGHANLLIYDKTDNTVYRFEPNGHFYPMIDIHLSKYFSKYRVNYKPLDGFYENNIMYGPQGYANMVEKSTNIGTCMYWSYMISNLIQENFNSKYLDDKTLPEFIKEFYDELYYEGFTCSGYIQNFIKQMNDFDIEKLLDPSVDSTHISWERICLMELSEDYIKRILKDYWYCWEIIVEMQKHLSPEFIKENDVYSW